MANAWEPLASSVRPDASPAVPPPAACCPRTASALRRSATRRRRRVWSRRCSASRRHCRAGRRRPRAVRPRPPDPGSAGCRAPGARPAPRPARRPGTRRTVRPGSSRAGNGVLGQILHALPELLHPVGERRCAPAVLGDAGAVLVHSLGVARHPRHTTTSRRPPGSGPSSAASPRRPACGLLRPSCSSRRPASRRRRRTCRPVGQLVQPVGELTGSGAQPTRSAGQLLGAVVELAEPVGQVPGPAGGLAQATGQLPGAVGELPRGGGQGAELLGGGVEAEVDVLQVRLGQLGVQDLGRLAAVAWPTTGSAMPLIWEVCMSMVADSAMSAVVLGVRGGVGGEVLGDGEHGGVAARLQARGRRRPRRSASS